MYFVRICFLSNQKILLLNLKSTNSIYCFVWDFFWKIKIISKYSCCFGYHTLKWFMHKNFIKKYSVFNVFQHSFYLTWLIHSILNICCNCFSFIIKIINLNNKPRNRHIAECACAQHQDLVQLERFHTGLCCFWCCWNEIMHFSIQLLKIKINTKIN